MSTKKLSNISIAVFRRFLNEAGLKMIKNSKGRGGHEKWSRKDLLRPVTIQTHIDPVPEFIVTQVLRNIGMSKDEFFDLIDKM